MPTVVPAAVSDEMSGALHAVGAVLGTPVTTTDHDEWELDDRGLRPGSMFADIELIGIPHRVVVSGRGLEAGTFEYRARAAAESENLDRETLLGKLRG